MSEENIPTEVPTDVEAETAEIIESEMESASKNEPESEALESETLQSTKVPSVVSIPPSDSPSPSGTAAPSVVPSAVPSTVPSTVPSPVPSPVPSAPPPDVQVVDTEPTVEKKQSINIQGAKELETAVSNINAQLASSNRLSKSKLIDRRKCKHEISAPHQYMYKEDKHKGRRMGIESKTGISCLRNSGPDRNPVTEEKAAMNRYRPTKGGIRKGPININPACAVPMRARPWKPMTWLPYPPPKVEAWQEEEERDKDSRDCQMAMDLGYETLVGNILHIEIPGAPDLNRSFQNFLSSDPVEWGFPYNKGTVDRPRCCLPQPYLAHQVKERLWKYPRTRLFQTKDE